MASPGLFSGLNKFLFGDTEFGNSEFEAQERAKQEQQIAEQYRQREQQDYARQVQLAQYLQRVIGGNAPSVAQGQMVAGQDAAQRASMGAAAGATGVNAGLAQYGSILAGSEMASNVNQQAAQLRAQEIANAVQQTGQLTNSMGGRSAVLGQGATQFGLDYNKLGFGLEQSEQEQRNKENGAVMSGIGDAASLYFGGGYGAAAKKATDGSGNEYDNSYTPAKV